MIRVTSAIVASFFLLLTLLISNPAGAAEKGIAKVDESIAVLEQLTAIPEKGIPPALLSNAGGIAIIPGVIKAGFIVGGRYGTGILLLHDKDGGWSNPVFITLAGGSIGWQVGVESIDIILVFKSNRSIESILKGKFTLGADASVAAGPVGREASASTDVQLKSEIYSYSRSRGLFAGLSLEGASMQIDDDVDAAFYGKKDILPREVIRDRELTTAPEVDKLKKLLKEYSSGKTEN